ncbi:MAG: DNA primase [Bacilli bacterium]|nr:DNA primase [Mycoplasmatota bacterium]MDD6942015.1 DNA primase [bacterium]MDY2696703.1 DNA primase [Bacilli bacterium]MEE0015245.1 DNA primase [Bacilli bacterium]
MNNDLANEIRSKTDIVDIIGERIPLVARGKNFFGVCPFHDDSNPSMCVSREKQIYTCFSCHATGNVYTFLMNYDHIGFREALKYLGDKVGVNVSSINIQKKSTKFDKFYEAYNFSVKYFQNNLSSTKGKAARNYLSNRGINEATIKEFEIGLSLDTRDDLTKLLVNKKYDLGELNRIGLSSDDHDIYNDRIMFPLYNVSGQVVGFSGRIYNDNGQNKYLNTKETDIFKKGEMLYHYHIAREECRLQKSVIVMEGFMDVIRASTIGIKNTVALMGTALTNNQFNLIKRLSNNIILCLDGDEPGVHAMLSIGDHLLEQGVEVKVVVLPNDDDPDSFILKNGKDRFVGLIENALNFSDFKMQQLRKNVDFRSDEEKSNYINTVLKETVKINDSIRVEIVLKRLAKEFDISYNTLEKKFKDLSEFRETVKEKTVPVINKVVKKTKYDKAVEQILYFMLNNDWVISQVEAERVVFPSEESRILSSEIIYYYKLYGNINVADFYTYVQDKEDILVLLNSILASNYNEETTKEELFLYFKVIREYRSNQEIKRLTNLMKKEVDPLEQAKIANKIRTLRMGE